MRNALLIAALVAASSPAGASTIRLYTPGGAPCAGLCSYEWAVERFQVPTGTPERMMIPKGSLVLQMSYARDGKPYAMTDSAMLAEDEPGQGYYFTDATGRTLMMVQLDRCQNWSVMQPPVAGLEPPGEAVTPPTIYLVTSPPPVTPWEPPEVPWTPWEPPCCVVPPVEPPTPPAVPLPASWVLLVGALVLLAFLRRARAAPLST